MKTKFYFFASLFALAMLLAGCNTVSTSTNEALGVATYPPTNPLTIQILNTPPTRAHIRLGDIQAEPYGDSVSAAKITAALQKSAAKLGADAVVIVYDRNQIVGGMVMGPWYGRSIQAITQRVVVGVAIKYL